MADNGGHQGTPQPPRLPRDQDAAGSSRISGDAPSDRGGDSTQNPQEDTSSTPFTHGPFSPWSASSEKQLGHGNGPSDISGDRVFPIRSVITVEPSAARSVLSDEGETNTSPQTPMRGDGGVFSARRTDYTSGPLSPDYSARQDQYTPGRRSRAMSGPVSSIQADAARHGSIAPLDLGLGGSDKESDEESAYRRAGQDSISSTSESVSVSDLPHVTTRFTHVETEDGHAIITGRDGVLQQCEDEPIHTPGAVQGFGALVAMREDGSGNFVVRYASENTGRIIGYTPKQLFRLKSFTDVFTEEQQDNLLDHIDFIRDEDADPATNGPEVLSLSIKYPKRGKTVKLWCALHINNAHPDLIICEFELDDDTEFPLRPVGESTPVEPHDTLHSNPTLEDIEDSTEILSKPLRILRSARKRRGEQAAMQVFDIMSQVQEQLASATSLDNFLKVLVGIVKELTGFHRVMIYQFDSSHNGKVVTELVDTSHTVDLYKGLHFPASDIPRQARELYKVNKVRLLYDRDLETARIVCRSQEDLGVPLDMTHAYLRAMSPIHLKYLANMAVRSSMSISINAFNELWGLIACHSYGDHGMRVAFPIRKMCRLVGDTASRNIERLSYASRLQARKLINTAPTDKNPSGYIIASSDDLLRLFDADFGLLSIHGETKILGGIEQSQEALAMLEYLRLRQITSVLTSQDIREDFPDLRYAPGFQVIAGLLYVPLSVGGQDFIVFFRKGQVKEVKWAGNPYEKVIREGTAGYLEPRSSFKIWNETVLGKCREWNEEQVETAAVLCLVYGKFIEVWRQKEAALESSKLTRLLLANSAHEVRTPLNAIINYLEIALEGTLDQETRDNLARSHSASKSLIYVINDLLDLTKAEEGQELIKDEVFDLSACITEATDPFCADTNRKGIDYRVTKHPGLPKFVHGDARRVRQALSNVTANAVGHTKKGFVHVDILVSEVRDGAAVVDFVVADSGVGMEPKQLDALFRDLEQVSSEDVVNRGSGEEAREKQETRTLGLGLAVVGRIVRTMDGQLRLKSEEGHGSRFVVQLPFQLPAESPDAGGQVSTEGESPGSQISNAVSLAPQSLTAAPQGEITLIHRASHVNLGGDVDKKSHGPGSIGSRRSFESGHSHGSQKSDADRLIDAIQTPLSLQDHQAEPQTGYFMSRQSSKEGLDSAAGASAGAVGAAAAAAAPPPAPPAPPNIVLPSASALSASPHSRKRSHGGEHAPSSPTQPKEQPGTAEVRDSRTPIRAIKVPDEYEDMPRRNSGSGVLYELGSPSKSKKSQAQPGAESLSVLVAEDDPINMRILRKRLERAKHTVHHAANGQECAAVYKDRSTHFDVVLMDMQMPIVDGLTSTKMIREIEQSDDHKGHSSLAASNRRIPIFAVSASLVEKEKQTYTEAGFDGWILKPVDFKRLGTLLEGIHSAETRRSTLYTPGEWERGGWFSMGAAGEQEGSSQATPTVVGANKAEQTKDAK